MRFERTKGSIANLSSGDISADDLLDMLVRTTQDVFEANHITKATALEVSDQSSLLMSLYNLTTTILTLYNKNQDALSTYPSFIQGKIRSAETELAEKEPVLADLNAQIQKEEETQRQLRDLLQEVESRHSHLLSVKKDCEVLRTRIEELNTAHLDEMDMEKKALEVKLAEREGKAKLLTEEKGRLQRETKEWGSRIDGLQDSIHSQQGELDRLKEENLEKQTELDKLKETIAQTQAQLEQIKKGLEELPQKHTKCMEAYQEAKNRITVIRNAVNSARNDALLKDNLFAGSQGSLPIPASANSDLAIAEKEIPDWDSLDKWLADMEQRVSDLLEVYHGAVAALVDRAENLTSQKEK